MKRPLFDDATGCAPVQKEQKRRLSEAPPPPFTLLRLINSGGQAAVWAARETASHAMVALKVVPRRPLCLDRALREKRALEELGQS